LKSTVLHIASQLLSLLDAVVLTFVNDHWSVFHGNIPWQLPLDMMSRFSILKRAHIILMQVTLNDDLKVKYNHDGKYLVHMRN
jgi:hypothetical protein